MKFTDIFDYRDGSIYKKGSNKPFGYFDKKIGYMRCKIKGKPLLLHRVIYAMFNGDRLPDHDVDHIDRDKTNNRIENLRPATRGQNVVNSRVRSDNPYGYKGVTYHKATGKYAAQTMKDQVRVHIGLFETPEQAAEAYNQKIEELFGSYAVKNEIRT
jgi:hypothetical protein